MIGKLYVVQPVDAACLDKDQHHRREDQTEHFALAEEHFETIFISQHRILPYGFGAAKLNARTAIAASAKSVPNTVASIFGLRIRPGSNGFLGSRRTFKM
jgi:hypothetical protein